MKPFFRIAAAAVCAGAAGNSGNTLCADDASAPYRDTKIEAKLNVTVKPDTQVLHFVRDNVDPDVVTKTYVLKHADPYELRGYLREMVQTRKVDQSDTGIQAVKYDDGTGILMVSAEDYRFEDSENGQGIDRIIAELDKPGVVAVTGQPMYLYNPKYRAASELRAMVRTAGADVSEDVTENVGGSDRVRVDAPLNLMFFKTTQFSRKNIAAVLTEYDRPYPEVRAKITVYELYAENDAKLGLDFQAWKNNDGIDLFNGGGRFRQNYAADGAGLARGTGWNDTRYFNFNPKWNTKYIDFLTSRGNAKILHSCELVARNNTTAQIERTNRVFLATAGKIDGREYTEGYIYLEDVVPGTDFELTARTGSGKSITLSAPGAVTLTVLKMAKNAGEKYVLTAKGGIFQIAGANVGSKVNAGFVEITEAGNTGPTEFNTNHVAAMQGSPINTCASNEFGFKLTLTPSITDKATMLNVQASNSSLIGFQSNGEARIQQGANVESSFMIANAGTKLVIGGLEKRDVIRVSGGVPLLKDIPFLGWIFSTESESTKKSQLLVVAEVIPVRPGEAPAQANAAEIKAIEKKLKEAGESNTFGYRQFLLDSDRKK